MGIEYGVSWEDFQWFDEENGYVVEYCNEYSNIGDDWGTWIDLPGGLTFRFWVCQRHRNGELRRGWKFLRNISQLRH